MIAIPGQRRSSALLLKVRAGTFRRITQQNLETVH